MDILTLLNTILLGAVLVLVFYSLREGRQKPNLPEKPSPDDHFPDAPQLIQEVERLTSREDIFRYFRNHINGITVTTDDTLIIDNWNFDRDSEPHETFQNWYDGGFRDFLTFGHRCMRSYFTQLPTRPKLLFIAYDIIDRIHRRMPAGTNQITQVPFSNNWYFFIVDLPHLIAFIFMADISTAWRVQLKLLFDRLIPQPDIQLMGAIRTGANAVYASSCWLIMNCINMAHYLELINSSTNHQAMQMFNQEFNSDLEVRDGLWPDMSNIFHRRVAYYGYTFTLFQGDFYNLSSLMRIYSTGSIIFDTQLKTICHPLTRFSAFGINSRTITSNTTVAYPSAKLGLFLLPFSGWLIYKTKQFNFAMRGQKPDIACYEAARAVDNLGQVWIHQKNIQLVNRSYVFNAETILSIAGLIRDPNVPLRSIVNPAPAFNTFSILPTNARSYIGRLPKIKENVGFILQYYHIAEYDIEIIELIFVSNWGVCYVFRPYWTSGSRRLTFRQQDLFSRVHINGQRQDNVSESLDLNVGEQYQIETLLTATSNINVNVNLPLRQNISTTSIPRIQCSFNGVAFQLDAPISDLCIISSANWATRFATDRQYDPNASFLWENSIFQRNQNTYMYEELK